jgi:hypothetical protein
MTEALESADANINPSPSTTASLALSRCKDAWTLAHQQAMRSNKGIYEVDAIATQAYCGTLPTLCGAENIRNFIACVAHGVAVGIIDGACASRLLYAAQVAKSALSLLSAAKQKAG